MKKILFFLLALWVNSTAFAHDIYYEGLCYNIISTTDDIHKGVEVTYFGSFGDFHYSGEVNIPEKFIQDGILYTVKSIGYCAFQNCQSLASITIPSSVTSIGAYAFSFCSSLTSITIPSSVTSIGDRAFWYCSSLTSITIPSGVTSIGENAFGNCSSLTSITIPSSVTSIGGHAFSGCSSLTSVTIPSSVTSIGIWAFGYCSSLTSITIPSSVTSIGNGAFLGCSSLTSITIPSSVTSIGNDAFDGCGSLTSCTQEVSINGLYFQLDYLASTAAVIPNPSGAGYEGAVTIPETVNQGGKEYSVTSIGIWAFGDCSSLTSVTIPSSVTSIGDLGFFRCFSLTSITIPSSVTSIGTYAFRDCFSLESVTFEEGNSSPLFIDPYAFKNCTNLKRVEFPSNLTFDSETTFGMFEGCGQLTYVKKPYLYNTYPSILFGKGDQYKNCYFEIPEGLAAKYINYGYYNISDLSQIDWMRGVFAGERDDIEAFADGLEDGAAKDELNAALELAQAKVDTMTSYVAIMGQIDAIKAAVMKFAGKVKLPNNTDVTSFVKNPRFDYESLGWDNVYTGDKIDSVLNAFVKTGATYENGEAKLDKFIERWTPMSHLENCKMEQTLTGLPAGHYRIEIDVLATTNVDSLKDVEGVWLVMNNQKIAVSTENNTPEHVTLDLEVLTAKDVKLGLHVENSNVRWIALDNFKLSYINGMPPAPAASELVSSEDTVYLYNVETGAFLNAGNSWGVQSVLSELAAPLKLTQNEEGAWEVFFYEGTRFEQKLFLPEEAERVFTDYNNWGCASWLFAPAPEGGYIIYNAANDTLVLGNVPTRKDYDCEQKKELDTHVDVIMTDDPNACCRWLVVSKEEGDVIMAKHQLYDAMARIKKADDVNEELLANAEKLYDQADAAYQEVKDMIVLLNAQLGMPKKGQPVDMTVLISNPRFEDNTPQGWLGASISEGAADNTLYETVEFFQHSFNMSQRIVGVPNGLYRLKWKGFHRPGYYDCGYFGGTDNASAVVYANDSVKTLQNMWKGATETQLGGGSVSYNGLYAPNNQEAARAYFDAGYYMDSLDVEVVDNVLTIGVRNTEEMGGYHWVIISDFELEILENGKAIHNKLSLQDSKGISGGKTTLKVDLNNEDALAGVQFDVQLPAGMSFSLDGSGKPRFTKSSRLSGMTVMVSLVNGKARVLAYGVGETVKGNSGNIISLEVNISDELANGDYEVQVLNTVLTEPSALEIKPFNVSGKVTLVEAEIGDANKDGSVNVTDIISVANYILGDTSGSFDSFAADMNGDGSVNVTDIISIANLILGGSPADAKSRMPFELDPQ